MEWTLKFGEGGSCNFSMNMGAFPTLFSHRTLSIPMMLLQSSWAVLLLCTAAGFLGWLGLAAPPEKVGTSPQSWGSPHKSPSRQPRVTAGSGMKPNPRKCHTWTPVTVWWLCDTLWLGNLDSGIPHPGQPLCLV